MEIIKIDNDKKRFLDLLLLADEQEDMIDRCILIPGVRELHLRPFYWVWLIPNTLNMKTREIPENIFKGEFAVLGYDSYDEEKGWAVGRRDEFDGICEWRFEQTSAQKLLSGNIAYSGKFSNYFKSLHLK